MLGRLLPMMCCFCGCWTSLFKQDYYWLHYKTGTPAALLLNFQWSAAASQGVFANHRCGQIKQVWHCYLNQGVSIFSCHHIKYSCLLWYKYCVVHLSALFLTQAHSKRTVYPTVNSLKQDRNKSNYFSWETPMQSLVSWYVMLCLGQTVALQFSELYLAFQRFLVGYLSVISGETQLPWYKRYHSLQLFTVGVPRAKATESDLARIYSWVNPTLCSPLAETQSFLLNN